jgi:hypothetical protein
MPTNFNKPASPVLQAGNTLATGLSRCFPLTEGSGTLIHDLSTNGNNLTTFVGGSAGAITWGTDVTIGALLQMGATDTLQGVDTALPAAATAFTVAALIKTSQTIASQINLVTWGTLSGGNGEVYLLGVNGVEGTANIGTGFVVDSSMTASTDGNWHLLLMTFDATTGNHNFAFYMDDATPLSSGLSLNGGAVMDIILVGANGLIISANSSTGALIGDLGGVWTWNRALSSGDITAFYADPYQMVRPAISMTVAPTTDTNAQSVVYTVTGTGTSWTSGTTFGISGVTGASITSQSITGQVGTVTVLFDNTHIGTLTFTNSTDSNTATTAITLAGPGIPATPSCTPGNNQNVLNWSVPPSGGLTATYNVYRGTSPGGESGTALATLISPTTYTDSTAVNGTAYYYKIAAVNATGTGTHSSEVSGTPAAGPSMAVDVSTHANAASVVYTLTGTDSSWVGGTTFSISGVTGAAITAQSVNVGAQTGSVTVHYDNTHIGTLTFADSTDSATATTAVTLAAPSAPANPTAAPSNTAVILGWQVAPTGGLPATYNIYRGTSPSGESGTPIATGVAALNYTDTGLTNGTHYYYYIKAVNGTGTSGQSTEVSAVPNNPPPGGGADLIMAT